MPWVIRIANSIVEDRHINDVWVESPGNEELRPADYGRCDWTDRFSKAHRWADLSDAVAFAMMFDVIAVIVVEVET